MFRLEDDEILDADRLGRFLSLHAAEATFRYKPLMDAYMTDMPYLFVKSSVALNLS